MTAVTPSQVLDAHPGAAVLTLDFFDTLVTRSVAQPTHVFAVMERELVAEHGERWAGFALRRVLAERGARSALAADDPHADVTFAQVLSRLAVDMRLGTADREMLARLETDTEIRHTVPVAWGAGLLAEARRRGLRVLVVSDNYMSSGHLVAVARAAGIELSPGEVIVSCEHGAMKRDGSLWRVVLDRAGVGPSGILHVGDLDDADGSIPAGLGIATHVEPAMRVSQREPLNTVPSVLPLSRIEAANRSTHAGGLHPVMNLATGAVAVIVAGQVLDIVRRCAETPVAGVHFTARDGHLAHAVYGRVRASRPDLPPHTYTEVSRSVAWRASLVRADEETVERFVAHDERLTTAGLGRRFGCELVSAHAPDEPLDATEARAVVVANAGVVEEACAGLRDRLLGYLDRQGVTSPGHHLMMDLGWSGSVVADVARVVRGARGDAATFEGRLTALYWDASPNRRSIALNGLAMDEFGTVEDNLRLLGALRVFEALLTAPHASVADYHDGAAVRGGTAGAPDLGVPWEEYEDAVVGSATAMVLGGHPLVRPEEIDGRTVWATMMQVACTPTDAEVRALGGLHHETAIDHAGAGTPLVATAPVGFAPRDAPAVHAGLMRRHWLQGSLAAWWTDPASRWIADEIRRAFPPAGPQWVGP